MKLYMFRTVPLSIIRSFSLYTQQCYMSYNFADCLRTEWGFHPVILIVSLHVFLRTAASPWLLQRTIILCQWYFLSHIALHTLSINTDTHSACLQTPWSVFLSYSQIASLPGVQKFSKLLWPQGWYKAGCTLGIHKYEEPPYQIWSPGTFTPADLCHSFRF
jgi:hypothetical protein